MKRGGLGVLKGGNPAAARLVGWADHVEPPALRHHPRCRRFVSVQRPPWTAHLRGQGQEPAVATGQLLPKPGPSSASYRPDGGRSRIGGMDSSGYRGGGADVGVQPHPAAPAPVQRPVPGRQELPVPVRHHGGRVAQGHGHPGPQEEGQPLFRPLRPRLRHPGDPRPTAAHIPDPHMQRQQVQPPRPPGPAVSAVPHREVRRTVRGRGGAGALRRDGGRLARLPRRRHRRRGEAAGGRHGPGFRRPGIRAGRPLPGSLGQRAQGHRGPADGGGPLGGLRRGRPGGRRAGGRLPGVLRPQGPGDGPPGLHRGQGGRPER